MKIDNLFIIFVLSFLFLISCDDGETNEPRGNFGDLCYEDHTCNAYSNFVYYDGPFSYNANIYYACNQDETGDYRCIYDHEINLEPKIYECLKTKLPGLFFESVYAGEKFTASKALLFKEIDCSSKGTEFDSLKGIGYFKNLEKLTVIASPNFNTYTLQALTKLNYLNMQNFSKEQLNFLKKTPSSIKSLVFINSEIDEKIMSIIQNKELLTNLEINSSNLNGEKYSLGQAKKSLTSLKINSSNLSDIDFIGAFTNLTYLNLYNNPIYSVDPLKPLKKLKYLNIRKTCVTDINPIWTTLRQNDTIVERPEYGDNFYESCEF